MEEPNETPAERAQRVLEELEAKRVAAPENYFLDFDTSGSMGKSLSKLLPRVYAAAREVKGGNPLTENYQVLFPLKKKVKK